MILKINEQEIDSFIGKFIIQMSNNDEKFCLSQVNNIEFWIEKRIKFVAKGIDGNIILNGFHYCHGVYTRTEFTNHFNNPKPIERGYRLLTSRELKYLMTYMIEHNY